MKGTSSFILLVACFIALYAEAIDPTVLAQSNNQQVNAKEGNSRVKELLQDNFELISVIAIYRHGDRTPVDPYPLDPYKNESFWPVDFGQLTNLGKQQHFELGKWLRNRYAGFLPTTYNENDIYIRATDVDRTLMSAYSNLAGLYPPTSARDVWNKGIHWQPIPVHTMPEAQDILLAMKTPCPRYNVYLAALLKQPFFVDLAKKNQELYEYVTRSTGRQVNDIQTLEFIYNTLFIEDLYNYTLPEWTTRVYPDVMRPLAGLSFAIPCYNADLARLKTGPLMFDIVKHLRSATNPAAFVSSEYHPHGSSPYIESNAKDDKARKMRVYSAHDTTIANVLNTLGLFDPHSPPYASTILFELKRNVAQNIYYVNVFYKNTSKATPMTLPSCDFDCDFEKFERLLEPVAIDIAQWSDECEQLTMWSFLSFESVEGIVVFVLCLLVGMFLMMMLICLFCGRPKCEQQTYLRLPDDDETV